MPESNMKFTIAEESIGTVIVPARSLGEYPEHAN
jgi:hypothetical protein